jgi:hypothetical protein
MTGSCGTSSRAARGTGIASGEVMTMLRWTFTRNHDALTCELDANAPGNYDVSVVPHWDVSAAAIEHFDGATRAFERHAELARYLRETGWHLARRGTSRSTRPSVRAA